MMVNELKKYPEYEFECNMSNEYKNYNSHDEWGCAFVWVGDVGVEYNFCIDSGENCCAIYKIVFNHETGYMETDSDTFNHYEINFNDSDWVEKLENAMCESVLEFHYGM